MKRQHNTKSELPSGYTRLQYIESTGTQWIDTGVQCNYDIVFETDFRMTDILGNYGEGADNWNGGGLRFRYDVVEAPSHQNYGFRVMMYRDTKTVYTPPDIISHNISLNSNTGVVDFDENITTMSYQANLTGFNLYLFAINTPSGAAAKSKMRKTYCRISKQNGDLVRNLIPTLRNSDSKPGLYDTINNVFYTNQGSGEFLFTI